MTVPNTPTEKERLLQEEMQEAIDEELEMEFDDARMEQLVDGGGATGGSVDGGPSAAPLAIACCNVASV